MINNSISFTSRDCFLIKPKKEQAEAKETEEKTEETPQEETEDIYTYDYYENIAKQEDRRALRQLITGALIGASLLSAPIALDKLDNEDDYLFNCSPRTEYVIDNPQDQLIYDCANVLAKGGKDSTRLETKEFEQLIDYSKLNCIPHRATRETARIMTSAAYKPVDMNSPTAKKDLFSQIKSAQQAIDKIAEDYQKNPPKSYWEREIEYAQTYITDNEILDEVDFSELSLYQKDMTVLRSRIRMSNERIKRTDIDAEQKKQKQIEHAQRLVDSIVAKYKMKASVSGNYNADDEVSLGEFISLLNMQNLKDLPDEVRIGIIRKAVEQYKPVCARYATDKRQVDMANEKVEEARKKAQDILDRWAMKAQDELFPILHPNEIRVRPREMAVINHSETNQF